MLTVSSRKTERLINLTIALLASKRFLTKNEIFRTIEGYEGSAEANERMFERDKDDLRTLGIAIEVGELDILFNDEPGYRIKPESYALNLGELSGLDIALLSLATEVWRDASFSQAAQSARIKLASLGIASDYQSIPAMAPRICIDSPNFAVLVKAITDGAHINFEYLASNMEVQQRDVDPYGVGNRFGAWYLVGFDSEKHAIRTFRLDRIRGQVARSNKLHSFRIPNDFNVAQYLDENLFQDTKSAIIRVRKNKGRQLRIRAAMIVADEEFDTCTVPYPNEQSFIDLILWHGEDVVVLEPASLRESVIAALEGLVKNHD